MKLGLIGKKLSHSFSKNFFDEKFRNEGLDNHTYQNIELENLDSIRQVCEEQKIDGFNVTIPFKEEIIKQLDSIDVSAAEINAVNVVKIEGLKWSGYNTDYIAFRETLIPMIEGPTSALVLGSGGAAKAVSYALRKMGIKSNIVSRKSEYLNYSMLNKELMEQNKLIINTTPLGMHPNVIEFPPIPYEFINEQHLCYDLIYNPEKSMFLELSEKRGAKIINGKQMLEIQAVKSWEIWNS